VQAAVLVCRAARGRAVDVAAERALQDAVLRTDLHDVADLFGDLSPWSIGLESAHALLSTPNAELTQAAKHVVSLLQVEADLRKRPVLAQKLRSEIESVAAERATLPQEEVSAVLGGVYQRTLSTLPRRVHVSGDPAVLQRPAVAARIRGLLLGGVRCAWLWHSLGGRRWHLLLKRTTIRAALRASQSI